MSSVHFFSMSFASDGKENREIFRVNPSTSFASDGKGKREIFCAKPSTPFASDGKGEREITDTDGLRVGDSAK